MSCCTAALVCSGTPSWIGDGYCDKTNNNERCQWDGGDCCTPSLIGDGICDETNNNEWCQWDEGDCCTPSWIGDGYCDETNNNEGCQWDGDDCCNGGSHDYCNICECLDPNY